MKGSPLALIVAVAGVGCAALSVDYYDPARQVTRRVSYESGARSVRASDHQHVEESSVRRLNSQVFDGITPIKVRLSANPEEFFLKQNATAVIVFGTSIELVEDNLLWSPGLDLVVKATHVTLPRSIKMNPNPDGTGRSVQISAWKLNVPDEGCTIDVSGRVGVEEHWAADDGKEEGENGVAGADGMKGGQGGSVVIQAGSILGGKLTIEANGGRGGNGQAGGNGRRGKSGAQLEEQNSCCKRKKADRVTTGAAGLPGGNAGTGGSGGEGGVSGWVQVLTVAGNALPNVVVHNNVGQGGAEGKAGQPGAGGYGGPGSGTTCVKMDRFGFDRRCTFPLGKTGEDGVGGAGAVDGSAGFAGPENPTPSENVAANLTRVRKGSCGQHLRFEQYLADKLYREAHEGADYAEARSLYEWVEAVRGLTPETCTAEEQGPWYQTTLDASLKLQQMQLLQDFWGFRRDSAPLLTFDSLLSSTQRLLSMAQMAEGAYDLYLSDSTSNAERKSLVVQAIHNLDYDIEAAKKEMEELAEQIALIRPEIIDLDGDLAVREESIIEDGAKCDLAIKKKAAGENYNRGTGLKELLWYTKATTRILDQTFKILAPLLLTVGGIWVTGGALVPLATITLPGIWGATGVSMASLSAIQATVMGAIPVVNTIVGEVKVVKKTGDDVWTDLRGEMDTMKDKWGENKKALDSRSQSMMLSGDFDKLVDEWIGELPDCKVTATTYKSYKEVADQLNAKISQHDMYIMQFAGTQMRRSKAMADRKDLWINSANEFSPTGMKFMASISESYRSQKSHIITMMKQLREAMNYEDCATEPFKYQDARVVQLQVFVADIVAERKRKHSTDLSRRAVIAHNPESVTQQYGPKPTSVVVVTLEANNMAAAFSSFVSQGTLKYSLMRSHPSLPKAVANLRVVSAQAFVPALMGQGSSAQVWMKRAGASTCTDPSGAQRTFSHAAQGYISVFSTEGDVSTLPTFFSRTKLAQDTVGPSPLGQWDISLPQLDEAGRAAVKKVELHLVLSYIPCATPECSQGVADSSVAVALPGTLQSSVMVSGALLALAGTAFSVLALVLGMGSLRRWNA